jgi:tripartite-type tricarboxylate transporter receptor subunit TctC
VPYDLFRDFTTVGLIGYTPHITVVHPSLPVQSLTELIRLAKAKPGEINYSSSGNGVGSHLAVELFKSMAKVDVTHVPYKGAPAAVSALLSGEVSLMIVNLISALPHVQSGKMRALGLADTKRSPLLPQVPTMTEAGLPGYVFTEWYGLIAPAAMPKDAIAKWNAEVNRIVATPEFKDKLATLGAVPSTGTPEQFTKYFRAEADRYAKLVKEAGIKPE